MPKGRTKLSARKSTFTPKSVPTFHKPKPYSEPPSPTTPPHSPSSFTPLPTTPPYSPTSPPYYEEEEIPPTGPLSVRRPPTPPRPSAVSASTSTGSYFDRHPGAKIRVPFTLPSLSSCSNEPSEGDGVSNKCSSCLERAYLESCRTIERNNKLIDHLLEDNFRLRKELNSHKGH
jgi:hypothetical protein